jgi:hypothetical protein
MMAEPSHDQVWWMEHPDGGRRPACLLTRRALSKLAWLREQCPCGLAKGRSASSEVSPIGVIKGPGRQ